MSSLLTEFIAKAPASSANLGPGFDALGLGLDLWNELRVTPGSGRIALAGEGADQLPTDSTNLVARCFNDASGGRLNEFDLHCASAVPLARGLGSSTAAAAVGLCAGYHVAHTHWSAGDLFRRLQDIDGHPDNAAACAYGGLVVADQSGVQRISNPAELAFVAVVPPRQLETSVARDALPSAYQRSIVATAVANAAGLVAALASGDTEALRSRLEADVVHEPFRAGLVPELAHARALARASGGLGATLSGSGTTVLVWATRESIQSVTESLASELPECAIYALEVASRGAHLASFTTSSTVVATN